MDNLHDTLTGLVEYAQTHLDPSTAQTETAIATAEKQIRALERGRVEKLIAALDKIWTNPMAAELSHAIAGTALAEYACKNKAALAGLEE